MLVAQQARAVRRRSAAWYRGAIGLCEALRIEAHFGRVAARLTRRALGGQSVQKGDHDEK